MFKPFQLDGLEWQQKVTETTSSGKYRVEITWALDRYRVTVYSTARESVVRIRRPFFAWTAIQTANRLLRQFEKRDSQ